MFFDDNSLINNKLSATNVSCLDATALSKSFSSRHKNNYGTSEYKKPPKLVGGGNH